MSTEPYGLAEANPFLLALTGVKIYERHVSFDLRFLLWFRLFSEMISNKYLYKILL